MPEIYILRGPVQSGKTSRLEQWAVGKVNIYGLLAPIMEGKRYLKNIYTGEMRLLEADNPITNRPITRIGKFAFYEDTFEWGRRVLTGNIPQADSWMIIDEIGPLELQGRGLEPAVSSILGNAGDLVIVVLVVREKLFNDVLQYYAFDEGNISVFNFEETQ